MKSHQTPEPLQATTPELKAMKNEQFSPLKLFLKATALALGIALVFLLLTAIGLGVFAYTKAQQFANEANTTLPELQKLISVGLKTQPIAANGQKNILLLGTDAVQNRVGAPVLTDAIVLISVGVESGKISAVSLPRDLWHEEYQTKINALLHYGATKTPANPALFPTTVISELTGVPIHHTIVLSLEQVAVMIDLLGGISLDLKHSFADTRFPRDDVALSNQTDPAVLYKTVQFEKGPQVLTGERALEYMRSRHSEDSEGTDQARSERQQEVLAALLRQLTSAQTLLDSEKMAKIFMFYQANFSESLSTQEATTTAIALFKQRKNLQFSYTPLPIQTESEQGVVFHPPVTPKNPQWIYQVQDKAVFTQLIQSALNQKQ